MHFGARMVKRRNAQENVIMRLSVVVLLDDRGPVQRAVLVQNSLREAGCAGGKMYYCLAACPVGSGYP